MIAVTLRLPDALHARLTAKAEEEHRSLNSQLIVLLEQALKGGSGATKRS
jgi:hypothetical protein